MLSCGSAAELVENAHHDWFVRCTNKQCAARMRQHHENAPVAVVGWNARAERVGAKVAGRMFPVCSECGSMMGDAARYCPNCGVRVGDVGA